MKVDDNLTNSSKDDKIKEEDDKKVKKDDEKIEEVGKSDEKIPKGMVELKFKPFQTMIILGKRNTGKSYLTKYLIHQLVNQGMYNTVYLFSTTERYSHSFNCLPKEYIINGFDLKFIQNIIDAQRKRIEKYSLESEKVAKIMMVFDDLVGSISTSSKEMQMLNFLFATSRHIGISLVVFAQASRSSVNPTLRQNVDWLFFRNEENNCVHTGELHNVYRKYESTHREHYDLPTLGPDNITTYAYFTNMCFMLDRQNITSTYLMHFAGADIGEP